MELQSEIINSDNKNKKTNKIILNTLRKNTIIFGIGSSE